MSSKERAMAAVAVAYHGLPIEYHLRLAERLIACVFNWVDDCTIEDVLCDIKYHGDQVKAIYREQI